MVFSMRMVDGFLEGFRRKTRVQDWEWRIAYIRLEPCPAAADADPSVLYVSRTDTDTVLCCNGEDTIEVFETTLEDVFNVLNERFIYYYKWEYSALNAVSRKKDQRKNFRLLSDLFPDFSVKVLNPEGLILYFDGEEPNVPLDARMIYLMRNTPNCHEVVEGLRDLTVFFSAERYKKHILFARINYSDGVFLLLSILEQDKPITNVEIHLAELAQKIFSRAEFKNPASEFSTREATLLKLIKGELCEQGELTRFESYWGSGIHDGAILAVMELPQDGRFGKGAILASIRRSIPAAFPMQHKGRVLCLLPAGEKPRDMMRRVAESSELHTVVSTVIHSWDQLKNAWQLADYVLSSCPKDGYLVNCTDFLWDYDLHCMETIASELPIHPDLLMLKSLKDSKDNMLLETLYCYLANNCKMAQVAEELHIHLSTLKYRMAHIQDLIGFDPREYKDRMAFLLSYDLINRSRDDP